MEEKVGLLEGELEENLLEAGVIHREV